MDQQYYNNCYPYSNESSDVGLQSTKNINLLQSLTFH